MYAHALLVAMIAMRALPGYLTLPIELNIINAINTSEYLCAVLWLPGVESAKTSPWTTNLPFPVEVWTHLGNEHVQKLKDYGAFYRNVVVVIPSSSVQQRAALLESLREDIIFLPLVRLLFVLKDEDPIPNDHLGKVSCALIFVNATTIDAPEDSYRNCSKRVAMEADQIFRTEKTRGWALLKGKSIIGLKKYVDQKSGNSFSCTSITYGRALLDSMKHINVTVIPFISDISYERKYPKFDQMLMDAVHKKFDFSCLTWSLDEAYQNLSDGSAVTLFGALTFHTAEARRRQPSLRYGSGTLSMTCCLGMFAVTILAIHFLRGRILKCSTGVSSVALLLYASIFGQYPNHPRALRNTTTITLLAFWMVGVSFLSSYIQSDFTSEVTVPGFSKSIETLDELEHLVKLKKVRPCVVTNFYSHNLIMRTQNGIMGTLRNSLIECGYGCTQNFGEVVCLEKSRKGTHVFIYVAVKSLPDHMRYPGVCAGTENLGVRPITFLTSKAFPYRQEHHRVVRTMTETGLHVPFRKKLNHTDDEDPEIPLTGKLSFRILLLLGCGSFTSLVVLLAELATEASRSNCAIRCDDNRERKIWKESRSFSPISCQSSASVISPTI